MSSFRSTASILINATAASVWKALTTPELMKQWFFGTETETDWSVGGPIVHRGEYQGQAYVDKGTVLAFEPEKLLVHTHWSSVSGVPDEPENYQTVSWVLTERDGQTELTVTDDNIRTEEAREASDQGWAAALSALKGVVES
jgi:uncharacterized protein YndB with AHSA1/START domain